MSNTNAKKLDGVISVATEITFGMAGLTSLRLSLEYLDRSSAKSIGVSPELLLEYQTKVLELGASLEKFIGVGEETSKEIVPGFGEDEVETGDFEPKPVQN